MSSPPLPAYGHGALSDLTPALLAAMGVAGFVGTAELGLERVRSACVLVIDGLGWNMLRAHREEAPFLWEASERARPITAGFPATTAASLGSIGTGLTPGEHGLVGYSFVVPGLDRALNALRWERYGFGPDALLDAAFAPERLQPSPTAFERATTAGCTVTLVGPPELARSPLERAILRGGEYRGAGLLDLPRTVSRALAPPGAFVYAYHPDLDRSAHIKGVDSPECAVELRRIDETVARLADALPPGATVVVTGDHGMIDVPAEGRFDLADVPELAAGVRTLAGEARARHVHAKDGAAGDVLAAWSEFFGQRAWVVTRDEAVDGGWFGPVVRTGYRSRIGDVVMAAREPIGVFQRAVDAIQPMLIGHHGSMSPDEQLVPLIELRG